jgi:hypothetical protein
MAAARSIRLLRSSTGPSRTSSSKKTLTRRLALATPSRSTALMQCQRLIASDASLTSPTTRSPDDRCLSRKAEALSRLKASAKPGLLAVGEGCVPQSGLSSPPSWVPWRDDTVQIHARSTPRLARRSVERCRGHATGACAASASLRYWWTNAMHMLPSPTAAATRLTGPNRTSPQAKIPGTLVSRR